MSDATIGVQNPAVSDSLLDAEQLTVSAIVVKRERLQIAGAAAAEIATVKNADPAATDYGLSVRAVRLAREISFFTSAARTTTQTGADQSAKGFLGIAVILDITVNGAGGSITLEIDGKDPVSGKYIALLTGAAETTVVTRVYRVYPTMVAVANATVQDALWETYRIKVTANNANSVTWSAGGVLLP